MKKFLTIFLMFLSIFYSSCDFFEDVLGITEEEEYDPNKDVTDIEFDQTRISMMIGDSEHLKVSIDPENLQGKVKIEWEYDPEIIKIDADNFGAIITPVAPGGTYIRAKCNNMSTTCLIQISINPEEAEADKYIFSADSVVQLLPGKSQKVSVSLYGGTIADMESFRWSIKDTSIASISASRNNCIITTKKTGSTQITVTHPDSKYEFTIILFCYANKMEECYITTTSNVVTVDKNNEERKIISVDLKNPLSAIYKYGFKWDYADEESKRFLDFNANNESCELIPKSNGLARLKVTHENAEYELIILVRVITVVKNVYINVNPSSTIVVKGSSEPVLINAELCNYPGFANAEYFEWVFDDVESAKNLMDYQFAGDTLRIQGKKNGTVKLTVKHSASEYGRKVVIILQEQIGSAIDSSLYITTTDNYIQTRVGQKVTIGVTLKGGKPGDEFDFVWKCPGIKGCAEFMHFDGTVDTRSVVSVDGNVDGKIIIMPTHEGAFDIEVSHPRCLYTTNIGVKIYSAYALLSPMITINTEESLIRLVNNDPENGFKIINAVLNNGTEGQENSITWTSDDESKITINPAVGKTSEIKAVGSGQGYTYITLNHKSAYAPKKILVLSADTLEEVNSMKAIYSDKSYIRISASGDTKKAIINLTGIGLSDSDIVKWTSIDPSICIVNPVSEDKNHLKAEIEGITAGRTSIAASLDGCPTIYIDVTVTPTSEEVEVIQPVRYLTTANNSVVMTEIGDNANLSVTGVNIDASSMEMNTEWSMTDEEGIEGPVFQLSGSPGSNVNITSLKKGKSVLTVKNIDSKNELKINAKCGEVYEWIDGYTVYIDGEDTVNIVKGETQTVAFALVNTTSTGEFSYSVNNANVKVEGTKSGILYIEGLEAGQSLVTVKNSLCEAGIDKEILVNIANSYEELSDFTYLSTKQNVLNIYLGGNETVQVNVQNEKGSLLSGFNWYSEDANVADVQGSGTIAVVYGRKAGSTRLKVSHDSITYPLEIIVNVIDSNIASDNPYITCENITNISEGETSTITANLIGGTDADSIYFGWNVSNGADIVSIASSANTCKVKGLKPGIAELTISFNDSNKSVLNRKVLVVVDEAITTDCYITTSESIIKMSPKDAQKSITATLVNGKGSDVYNYKWWADNYNILDINYTNETCLITPLATGTATIHVSHPKAQTKDILVYISQYSEFAFADQKISLQNGVSGFVNLQVPVTDVASYVKCYVNEADKNICTVTNTDSTVCISPKSVGQAIVYADLIAKNDSTKKLANTIQLLVVVTKADVNKVYITTNIDSVGSVINLNAGETKSLTANLSSEKGTIIDKDSSGCNPGLHWKIDDSTICTFSGTIQTGNEIKIRGLRQGETIIHVSHDEASYERIIRVNVQGSGSASVKLSDKTKDLYENGDAVNITATIRNSKYEEDEDLTWSIWSGEDYSKKDVSQNIVTVEKVDKAKTIRLYPKNKGSIKVVATMANGVSDYCIVNVIEKPAVTFYKKVLDSKTGQYNDEIINGFKTVPMITSETRLYFKVSPAEDKITNINVGDSSIVHIKGSSDVKYNKDENGEYYFDLIGGTKTGQCLLTVSTNQTSSSVNITNDYDYYFALNKHSISCTPETKDDQCTIEYKVFPKNAIIYVEVPTGIKLKGFTTKEIKGNNRTNEAVGHYYFDNHYSSKADENGYYTGYFTLDFTGEKYIRSIKGENTGIIVNAYNYDIPASQAGVSISERVGDMQFVTLYCCYNDNKIQVVENSFKNTTTLSSGKQTFSRFDPVSQTFFIGDGETISFDVTSNHADYSELKLDMESKNTGFIKDSGAACFKGKFQTVVTVNATNNNTTKVTYSISLSMDYKNWGVNGDSSIYKNNPTVVDFFKIGIVRVKYLDVISNSYKYKDFPVYIEIRNYSLSNT